MISWTPEGCEFKPGLNIYWTKYQLRWWFRLVFITKKYKYYFRYRNHMSPHLIYDRTKI